MPAARRIVLLAIVLAAAIAGAAVAATQTFYAPGYEPKDAEAAHKLAIRQQAYDLLNKATAHVNATRSGCKPRIERPATEPIAGAPSQAMLDALAPLRRPATPAELAVARTHRGFGFGATYSDYVRFVRSAGGVRLRIMITSGAWPVVRTPARCRDAQHVWLVKLLAGTPPLVRSVALKAFDQMRRADAQVKVDEVPRDRISLFRDQGGGGAATIEQFRRQGVFGAFGRDARASVYGLVPDGVATITVEYPKHEYRGPFFKPATYPSAYKRTIAVQQNVVTFHVPRGPGAAMPRRMVWRDENGAVVHVWKAARR